MAFEDEGRFNQAPAEPRPKTFEELYQKGLLGEQTRRNEDGSSTTFYAYRLYLQQGEPGDEKGLANFCLRALQAGYKQAMSSVTIPDMYSPPEQIVQERDNDGSISSVLFFLEKTSPTPDDSVPPSREQERR